MSQGDGEGRDRRCPYITRLLTLLSWPKLATDNRRGLEREMSYRSGKGRPCFCFGALVLDEIAYAVFRGA